MPPHATLEYVFFMRASFLGLYHIRELERRQAFMGLRYKHDGGSSSDVGRRDCTVHIAGGQLRGQWLWPVRYGGQCLGVVQRLVLWFLLQCQPNEQSDRSYNWLVSCSARGRLVRLCLRLPRCVPLRLLAELPLRRPGVSVGSGLRVTLCTFTLLPC